jgi:endonuclease-3
MPRESKPKKTERAKKVFAILEKQYFHAKTALRHADPWQLLVATILSAQCTDAKVNEVTEELFAKYDGPADFAEVPQAELEKQIRSTGFYRNKAKNVRAAARAVLERHGGEVPQTMEELTALPGVARKTANVVLGNAFGKNVGFVVDTHVKRLSGRLGFTTHADPTKVERDLMEITPQKKWALYAHLLIYHGRATCMARKPACVSCCVAKHCPQIGVR